MSINIVEFKKNLQQYVRFIFGGGLSLILNLLITYFLTEVIHFWHMISFGIALISEILFLFVYHSQITFKKNGKFISFIILILTIGFLNWIFVYFFSVILNISYLISIILVSGLISIGNYILNKNIIFKDRI